MTTGKGTANRSNATALPETLRAAQFWAASLFFLIEANIFSKKKKKNHIAKEAKGMLVPVPRSHTYLFLIPCKAQYTVISLITCFFFFFRTDDMADPQPPSGHRTCAVGCFVSCGPRLFAGTLSSSLDWGQAFAGKRGKMSVGQPDL